MATPPVLLLIFNRPDHAARIFARIREARPSRLFIHADGPRADRPGEDERCRLARVATEKIDWDCQVHRLYRDQNLGCGPGVSAAITWFFEHVEEGVILEDDCAPRPGFFPFCAAMLSEYRDNPAVMHVAGMGFSWKGIPADSAAFLSPLPFIWGWGTWRRAWNHYRFEMPPAHVVEPVLLRECPDRTSRDYWRGKFDATRSGAIRTWDYQWVFALWARGGFAVTPTRSLIENIGFGADSTHTIEAAVGYAPVSNAASPTGSPMATPSRQHAMKAIFREIFSPAIPRRFDDIFRRPAWVWRGYLALRRRLWARPSKATP